MRDAQFAPLTNLDFGKSLTERARDMQTVLQELISNLEYGSANVADEVASFAIEHRVPLAPDLAPRDMQKETSNLMKTPSKSAELKDFCAASDPSTHWCSKSGPARLSQQ